MDTRFSPHNTHLEDPEHFYTLDPQLRRLKQQMYIHKSELLDLLPVHIPGIYSLTGGRQTGKTTLLKQWMTKLLEQGVSPFAIAFLSGELIDDHRMLMQILETQTSSMPDDRIRYLMIDEITYIKDWDKTVKYAADAGLLDQTILILTGSDLVLIEEARMRFPGRRGRADRVDFHLYPLSFRETVKLKGRIKNISETAESATDYSTDIMEALFGEFNEYLYHGGYLTAINDFGATGEVSLATLNTYSDWIRGDMLKRGKQEHYLREILAAIIKRYNSQVTWNTLARDLSIDHPKTVADYAALLASMDALFIQPALIEDKLTGAPKKARKLMFSDPFIFHAVRSWLWPHKNPFEAQMIPVVNSPEQSSKLVEATVATHFNRLYPTFYIKADGEVDIAYIYNRRFWPIEVKWTDRLKPKDLKQILKYSNSRIFTKSKTRGKMMNIETEPLIQALVRLR